MGIRKRRCIKVLHKIPFPLQAVTPQIKAGYPRKAYTPSDMIQEDREHHLSLPLYSHVGIQVFEGAFGKDAVPCSTQNDGST